MGSRSSSEPVTPVEGLDLRDALEGMPEPAIVHDAGGTILWANAAAAAMVGAPAPGALVDRPMLDFVAPEDHAGVLGRSSGLVGGAAAREAAGHACLRLDGSRLDVEATAAPIGGGRVVVVLRDVTETRRLERELRESRQRLRELLDLVPVSLWRADYSGVRALVERLRAEGVSDLRRHVAEHPEVGDALVAAARVVDANSTAAELAGAASREELLAHLDRVFLRESRPQYLEVALQLAEGRRLVRLETWAGTLDGGRRRIEATCRLAPGAEETWDRVLAANVDATERHRTDSRLATIFDAAAEPIAITVGGRFERVNGAFARAFGFARPEDAVGVSAGELVAPRALPMLQERHRQRLTGAPPPDHYTARARRRDGTEFDVDVKTAGLREGDRIATVSILRDVTERLAAERRLTESERRFRELFEFVPVSLWEVDASGVRAAVERMRAAGATDLRAWVAARPEVMAGVMKEFRVVAVNAFGCAQFGAGSHAELLANLDKIHVPESYPRYRELGLQLAEGATVARFEGWSGTLSGDRRWIETAAIVVPGHEATWGRLLFASVDLTDRRRAEEEREALHERLRQSEKLEAVGRLAGGIAHDFNNVLAAILSYAELTLLGLPEGSELHEHQQRIREAALRARALVRQILAFSRRDTANLRVVDVALVVDEALSLMRAGIPSTVTVETRLDPEAGATRIDPTQLHQIVLNLCANARDAVGTYGRIEIAVAAVEVGEELPELSPGPYVRLRVRDDGTGMDEATKARIFEPYMTTKGPFGGHGLGLPVVHGIVSGAGGTILVESAPGRGATFDVYLPRHERASPEPRADVRGAAGRGERILLVDDEPLVRGALRDQLASLGYAVEVAEDGQQALARFQASPAAFDLVLTDQTMPRLAGADLARAILALRPELPVLLCTGYSERIDEESARRMGLRGLLTKPVERAALAEAIRAALGR